MLSFLCTLYKKHKASLLTLSGAAGSAIGFLWGFDLQKLTPTGTLSPEVLWQVRMFLTPVLTSVYFLTLLVFVLHHYKKDTEKYEAKLNPPPLFFDVNPEYFNPSTDANKETISSPATKPPIRSFLGPKIPNNKSEDFDTALARLKKLSEPK